MNIRLLKSPDTKDLEEYLAPHKEECMFIFSNLKTEDTEYKEAEFEGECFGCFNTNNQLEGVIVHYWNGNIMMHAKNNDVLENLILYLQGNIRRLVAGVLGPNIQAECVIKKLELSQSHFGINSNEGLYAINLEALNEPSMPNNMQVVSAQDVSKSILIEWMKSYDIETLGSLDDEILEKQVQEHWSLPLQKNDSWVLLLDGTPVALNARLEDMVQVGPLFGLLLNIEIKALQDFFPRILCNTKNLREQRKLYYLHKINFGIDEMTKDTNTVLPKTLFPFIWHFLKDHKMIVYMVIFLSIIAGFWGPFNSVLIKQLIDFLPSANDENVAVLAIPAALIVINFIVFDNFTWRSINYIWAKYVPSVQNKIIAVMLDYALSQSHGFYQNTLSGKVSKQITNLSDGIIDIITDKMTNFLRGGSLLLAAFAASYYVNSIFCLILITWFIIFATISISMSKKIVNLADKLAEEETVVVGELVDSLSNHSNVRIFGRKPQENLRMVPFFDGQRKAYYSLNIYSIMLYCIQGGLIAIMMGFTVFALVKLYGKGLVTIGDFALILGLSMETGHMTWFLMSEVDHFNKAAGKCKQSLMSLIVPLEIQDKPNASTLNCIKGKINFDQVKFHYKGTKPLFHNKSIEIRAGQKVGLVGYSGGGKSSFVNLILRLYDVTDGAILVDGQDIRDVTQDSLRASIAMIPQDPSLFHRSLMENIRYGQTNASDEEVIEAAIKAHAHEFISALPQGYDSLVGERGVKLSGGQRQRIAIARAILKNAPILILDEATSQLDSITEGLIQESLWELMQNKTTIVIAHRLSTLLHMDRILVFDKGKIVEDGAHSELLAKARLYKHLWDAQVGGFLSDDQMEERE